MVVKYVFGFCEYIGFLKPRFYLDTVDIAMLVIYLLIILKKTSNLGEQIDIRALAYWICSKGFGSIR
tara:strand:+ start:1773 stop:1973 length:201 start_codon:yes stop_codon:yes gene_type:complete